MNVANPIPSAACFMLKLHLTNYETLAAVDKILYDLLNLNDQVLVSYQRRRLTGRLQVLAVSPL